VATILVVENEPAVRRLLMLQLRHLGHESIACERRGAWRAAAFDLALLEPAAPGALELAHDISRDRPDVPLLFVSTREASDETRALAPAEHLVKPARLRRLGAALAGALASY
jgi:CheY-like chemotaxis protein